MPGNEGMKSSNKKEQNYKSSSYTHLRYILVIPLLSLSSLASTLIQMWFLSLFWAATLNHSQSVYVSPSFSFFMYLRFGLYGVVELFFIQYEGVLRLVFLFFFSDFTCIHGFVKKHLIFSSLFSVTRELRIHQRRNTQKARDKKNDRKRDDNETRQKAWEKW